MNECDDRVAGRLTQERHPTLAPARASGDGGVLDDGQRVLHTLRLRTGLASPIQEDGGRPILPPAGLWAARSQIASRTSATTLVVNSPSCFAA